MRLVFMRTVGHALTATQQRQIAWSLFISFFIHFFLVSFLNSNPPSRLAESIHAPVRLFVTERPSVSEGVSKKVKDYSVKRAAKVQPVDAGANHDLSMTKPNLSASSRGYGRLLPRLDQLSEDPKINDEPSGSLARIPEHDSATKTKTGRVFGLKGERLSPEHEKWMDELGSKFIVPTLWRKSSNEGHAIALIRRDHLGSLYLDSLHGSPMLRAIIYHYLRQEIILSLIDRDFRRLEITEFKIILRFVKQNERGHGLNAQTSAFTDGLVVTKELPPEMLEFEGIPISDKEVERGRLIEKMEVSKLKESPAYSHRIDHFLLKE